MVPYNNIYKPMGEMSDTSLEELCPYNNPHNQMGAMYEHVIIMLIGILLILPLKSLPKLQI
jgi:hypothetical protein